MRARGLGARRRAPDLDQHDGFAALRRKCRHRDEFAHVLEAFDKTGDDARVRIVDQVAREIREVEIGFVAGGNDVGEADARVHRAQQERAERGGAALADERDVAGQAAQRARRSGRPDVVPDVGEAQAIGAGDAQAGLPRERADFFLQIEPRLDAAFGEAGGNDDRRAGLLRVTFLHHGEHLVVGHDDADQIRRFGQIGHAAIAFGAHDLVVIRIHGVDIHAVLALQHGFQKPPAVTALGGRADHRDRARVQHFVDRPHLVVRPHVHGKPFVMSWRGVFFDNGGAAPFLRIYHRWIRCGVRVPMRAQA